MTSVGHKFGASRRISDDAWDSAESVNADRAILPDTRVWTARERLNAIATIGEAAKLLRALLPTSQYAQRVARALDHHREALYQPPPLDPPEAEEE